MDWKACEIRHAYWPIKHSLFLLTIIAFTSCASTPESESSGSTGAPDWYMNLPQEEGYIYGYGSGQSQKEAAARALEDMAIQMQTRIQSKLESQISITGAEQEFSLNNQLSQNTDVEILGAEPLRSAQQGNQHFAAWRYNNKPLRVRILDAASSEPIRAAAGNPEPGQSSIKSRLPLSVFLSNKGKSADFMLDYRNGMYRLNINGQNIPVSRSEFAENFMVNLEPERFTIVPGLKNGLSLPNLPPDTLKDNQHYLVQYTPLADGYLNIAIMDAAGIVLALLKNHPVQAGETVEYPDTSLYDGLIASKTGKGISSTDMILAIESAKPLDFINAVQNVSEFAVNPGDAANYIYGELLELLSGHSYSAKTLRITD